MAQARGVRSNLPGPLDPAVPHDYTRVRLSLFDGGLNTAKEPEQLATNELSAVSNMIWYDGQLLVDSGYFPWSAQLPFGDQPHVPYEIFYPDGTEQLLLLSTTTLYVLSGGNSPQWQYVNWTGPTTMTSQAIATGASTFTVTSGSIGFIGAKLNIRLSNGQIWSPVITSIAGALWGVAPAVCPAPGANVQSAVSIVFPPKTVTNAVAPGAVLVPLSDVSYVSRGSLLGVQLSNGQQWQFSVVAVNLLVVTASSPCPSASVLTGAVVALAPTLAGNLSTQPVFVAFPALSWVIISNGIDRLMYYFNNNVADLPGLPDGTTCQAMTVFHESLHIANTVEVGAAKPQRLRMSDVADPTGWTPGQNGIAAIYDLVDTEDFILSLNLLGPWLIVYRETTIMRGTFLGLPLNTMFWEYMVYGEGVQSQGAVTEIGESHFLVGTQGVYEYAGGYELTSIGDNIFYQFLSAKGDLNAQAKNTLFTQYVADQDEVWILYPSGTSLFPNAMLRCSLEKHAWYPRVFANSFVSAGIFLPLQTTEWINSIGTWAQNTAAWDSRIFLQNQPNVILCAQGVSQTFVYDYKTNGDNGKAVAWSLVPKSLGDGDSLSRWDTLAMFGRGNGIAVAVSVDPTGDPLTTIPPVFTPVMDANGKALLVNFGVGKSRQLITFNGNVGTYIQFQFSGTDPMFTLEYAELWYSFESEY